MCVVGQASSGREALELARATPARRGGHRPVHARHERRAGLGTAAGHVSAGAGDRVDPARRRRLPHRMWSIGARGYVLKRTAVGRPRQGDPGGSEGEHLHRSRARGPISRRRVSAAASRGDRQRVPHRARIATCWPRRVGLQQHGNRAPPEDQRENRGILPGVRGGEAEPARPQRDRPLRHAAGLVERRQRADGAPSGGARRRRTAEGPPRRVSSRRYRSSSRGARRSSCGRLRPTSCPPSTASGPCRTPARSSGGPWTRRG